MGKRSDFPKIEKDAYMTTDPRAVRPLLDWYSGAVTYYEPCVGNGDLIRLLEVQDTYICVGSSDIELDARTTDYTSIAKFGYFISNPPWTREILHPIIDNLRKQAPTWLLFDADWMFTAQSNPYMKFCRAILPIGRLKWIPGTTDVGKDNCAWYLFVGHETETVFFPKLPALEKSKSKKSLI